MTKTCKQCGREFTPARPLQSVCRPACAMAKVRSDKKRERLEVKARKEAIKTIADLIRDADTAFCAYIRERDRLAGYECISSGRPLDWSGNQTDAGHFRSRGAASHLRYDENNCHAQSKHDNRFLGGNAVSYRIGLVARIGLDAVEALEANNSPHKWTREELVKIKQTYRAKLRELKERKDEL